MDATRFEAETTEIPAVTEEELEQLRRRKTPAFGRTIPAHSETEVTCTDPAYVSFLERQVQAANSAAESARAVFHAVGAHNAELTEEVRRLSEQVKQLTATVIRLQAELLEARAAK